MKPEVESARRDWEDAYWRLLEEMRDPGRADDLHRQVVVVGEELKKRLGSNYTLVELAGEYRRADNWVRHAVAERAASAGWPATLSMVEGAAFLLHSRGAVDYKP